MSQSARILLADDEAGIRLTLGALLQRAGYEVTAVENGVDAVKMIEHQPFDMLVVDLKMPELDGIGVVKAAHACQPDLAIIMLTGHGSLDSALDGFHHGIFDYLLKTADPKMVIERVKAGLAQRTHQLRERALLDVVGTAVQELRGQSAVAASSDSSDGASARLITVGVLQLDTWRQTATLDGRTLSLTPTEFRVLLSLAEHAGSMLSYGQLVRAVQGYTTSELEAGELIKPHIHHLRQKLEPDPATPRYILNVRGKGYLLAPIGE